MDTWKMLSNLTCGRVGRKTVWFNGSVGVSFCLRNTFRFGNCGTPSHCPSTGSPSQKFGGMELYVPET